MASGRNFCCSSNDLRNKIFLSEITIKFSREDVFLVNISSQRSLWAFVSINCVSLSFEKCQKSFLVSKSSADLSNKALCPVSKLRKLQVLYESRGSAVVFHGLLALLALLPASFMVSWSPGSVVFTAEATRGVSIRGTVTCNPDNYGNSGNEKVLIKLSNLRHKLTWNSIKIINFKSRSCEQPKSSGEMDGLIICLTIVIPGKTLLISFCFNSVVSQVSHLNTISCSEKQSPNPPFCFNSVVSQVSHPILHETFLLFSGLVIIVCEKQSPNPPFCFNSVVSQVSHPILHETFLLFSGLVIIVCKRPSGLSPCLYSKPPKGKYPRASIDSCLVIDNIFNPSLANLLLLRSGDVESNPGPTSERTGLGTRAGEVNLQVVSYNVRGIGDEKKCRHLINHFNKTLTSTRIDAIIGLQETLVQTPGKIPFIWRGNMHFTAGTGNGRGCMTLMSNHLTVISHRNFEERAHILALQKLGDQRISYIVANIYAPNSHNADKIEFYEEVLDGILEFEERFECSNVILLGDFNIIFKEQEKLNRAFSGNERRIAAAIERRLLEADLRDAWGERVAFTWRRANTDTYSKLDRVMYRSNQVECVNIEANWSLSSSDHAAVIASFKIIGKSSSPRRINIARLDPSLLQDPNSSSRIRADFVEMYSNVDDNWNPHVKLEFAKVCLRSVVERVQADFKRKERTDEEEVNESLNRLIGRLGTLGGQDFEEKEEIIEIIEALRGRKEALIEQKGKRLAERLATKWYNEGEKSNRYFMRLLNRQAPDKLDVLCKDDGTEVTDLDEINRAVVDFYKELYETYDSIVEVNGDDNFFNNLPRCSQINDFTVSAPLTVNELFEVLGTCRDSAPGPDGIGYGYIRFLWDVFGPLMVQGWEYSLRTGNLAPSHRLSFLRLIPKLGKDPKKLTNWRPITLSNCDHKVITKLYAQRLVAAAAALIDGRQTAYVKGRMINDNLRTIFASIEIANEEIDIDGLLVSLDAKKAFDSVDHQYIRQCLAKFGFTSFIKIFDILYKDLRSDIIVNGAIHRGYQIKRGVKQGDALSCILFIMCIEPLLRNIEVNPRIEKVRSAELESDLPKSLAYADDISCIIKNNDRSIQGIFDEYERLSKLSGLTLNADKTEFMRLTKRLDNRPIQFQYLNERFRSEPKAEIKVNGLLFQMDRNRMRTRNVDLVLNKIETKLWGWSRRGLSILGKILILKTFGVSQIIYLMQSMVLKDVDFKRLNSLLYKFIWNRHFGAAKAPDRIKREIINTPIKFGGFGMLDIQQLDRSLKLRMLSRVLSSSHPFLESIKLKINLNEFFYPVSNQKMEKSINQAVTFLAVDRRELFHKQGLTGDTRLVGLVREIRLRDILSANGRASITYFNLHMQGKSKLRHINHAELRSLAAHLTDRGNLKLFQDCISLNVPLPAATTSNLYWRKGLVDIEKLSSRDFRQAKEKSQPICVYKIGAILNPVENSSWTYKLAKLCSTKHKNLLLRIAHGDWYSNDRLHRFGLRDDPRCDLCGEIETIKHKVINCPFKLPFWRSLARQEGLDLDSLAEPIEFSLGMYKTANIPNLTLHAELIQLLVYNCPTMAPDSILQMLRAKINRLDEKVRKST